MNHFPLAKQISLIFIQMYLLYFFLLKKIKPALIRQDQVGKGKLKGADLQFQFIPDPTGIDDKHLMTFLGEKIELIW